MIKLYPIEELSGYKKKIKISIGLSVVSLLFLLLAIMLAVLFVEPASEVFFAVGLSVIWIICTSLLIYLVTANIIPLSNNAKHFMNIDQGIPIDIVGVVKFEEEPFTYRKNLFVQRISITSHDVVISVFARVKDNELIFSEGDQITAIIINNFLFSYEVTK